jgi:nucleoside-diphosphate-sugar epimerase
MAMIAVIGPGPSLVPSVVRRLAPSGGYEASGTDAIAGADAVVHVAGATATAWERNPDGAARDVVERTRQVLDRAAAGRVASVVHVSSAAVYGAWPDNPVPLPEDAPVRPNPGFAYAQAQAEAERLVADWRDGHPGVSVAVLRPTIVMGGDGPSWMARAVGAVQGPRPLDAGRPLQFVHADDVASAVSVAIDRRLDGTYNVAPDGWVPDETARALAGGMARLPLPGWMGRPLERVAWQFSHRGSLAEARPWTLHPWVVANDRLRAAGWQPSFTNEEAFIAVARPAPLAGLIARRRQELTLGAAGVLMAGAAGAVVVLVRHRARLRRTSSSLPGSARQ